MGIKAGDNLDLLRPQYLFACGIENHVLYQIFVKLHEAVGQAILSLKLNHIGVEGFILLYVVAESTHAAAPLINRYCISNQRRDLCIENPVDYIVFVSEVIVKSIAAYFIMPCDVSYGDVCEGFHLQQLLQALGNHKFCKVRV